MTTIDGQEPIPRRPDGIASVPLSAFQQRIYHLCTSYEGTSSPVVFLNQRLHGPLRTGALIRAIGMVVDRHESLRAVIADTSMGGETGPRQTFLPPGGHAVERIDLGDVPAEERDDRVRELLGQRTKTLFDLRGGEKDGLVRSALIRLDDADHVLSIVMHHIIADGASLGILSSDLVECYRAAVEGDRPELPDLSIGYGDFAHWQRDGLDERVAGGLAYWRERLAGVTPLRLPTDFERPAQKATRAGVVGHPIGPDVTAEVERVARASRCSTFMVLLAAYQILLKLRSGVDDICVGTPVAARTRVELEPVIGLFGNTLPMRCDLSGDPTVAELLKRVRSTVVGALSRQDVPFGSVVSHLDLPPDPSRTQVFQTIMALHTETGSDGLKLLDLKAEPAPAGMPQILHDIVLDMWLRPRGLDTGWRYDSALFTQETMQRLASDYECVLRTAVADPQTRLSALLPDAEDL